MEERGRQDGLDGKAFTGGNLMNHTNAAWERSRTEGEAAARRAGSAAAGGMPVMPHEPPLSPELKLKLERERREREEKARYRAWRDQYDPEDLLTDHEIMNADYETTSRLKIERRAERQAFEARRRAEEAAQLRADTIKSLPGLLMMLALAALWCWGAWSLWQWLVGVAAQR